MGALTLDRLVIDSSLVDKIAGDPTQRVLVRALRTLAESMGKELVAAGVDSAETLRCLVEAGVGYGEGSHLGQPVEKPDMGVRR